MNSLILTRDGIAAEVNRQSLRGDISMELGKKRLPKVSILVTTEYQYAKIIIRHF